MAIPAIAPYPMPAEHELPSNTARWRLDPARAVLLVHDMQNYFLAPFGDAQPVGQLLDNITDLRRECSSLGVPVLYTAQPGGMTATQRGLLADFWGAGMPKDATARAIVAAVRPSPGDVVLTKWRPSAFCRTRLLSLLRARGRDQLLICGVYAHVGILMTAHEAFSHDVQPFLVADAVADFSRRRHEATLHYAATRCAVTLSTRTALSQLRCVPQRPLP
jgi:isochorismate hydrolase